jgi:hypothetical protein
MYGVHWTAPWLFLMGYECPRQTLWKLNRYSVRTSIDLPVELHRRAHEAAARKGCSARKLILAGIERAVEEAKSTRPSRRLSLDPPLIRPAGRRIRITNEQAYELIELP